jgi:hypothetical protein
VLVYAQRLLIEFPPGIDDVRFSDADDPKPIQVGIPPGNDQPAATSRPSSEGKEHIVHECGS